MSGRDVDAIMEKAQEFASSWSLVGGQFDDGSMLTEAQARKDELRALLATPPAAAPDEAMVEQEGPDGEDGPWAAGWLSRCPQTGAPDPFAATPNPSTLYDAIMAHPYGDTTVGNMVCAEISGETLRPLVIAALTAALTGAET